MSKLLMARTLTASLTRDGIWFVAQCLEMDVASQGETPEETIAQLREALELHFEVVRLLVENLTGTLSPLL